MITGVYTGNGIPHDKYNIRGNARARRNRKDNNFMQRRLYIDETHTALDIFRFVVFFVTIPPSAREAAMSDMQLSKTVHFSNTHARALKFC